MRFSLIMMLAVLWPSPNAGSLMRYDWFSLEGIGENQKGQPTYADGMPLGNGDVAVLAWTNGTAGALQFYVAKSDAMSSATEPLKIALVSVAVSPWPNITSFFNQSLNMETSTLTVCAGGTGCLDALRLQIYVDANSNTIMVSVSSPQPVTIQAELTPVRPANVTSTPPFFCKPTTWVADVMPDPLPTVFANKNTVLIYHRNHPQDGNVVSDTLEQQQLSSLVNITTNWWSNLQFGLAMDDAGMGQLTRLNSNQLQTTKPQSSITLRLTLLAEQTASVQEWYAHLAALTAVSEPPTRRQAHKSWWSNFWARSYLLINATKSAGAWTDTPTQGQLPPGAVLWLRADALSLMAGTGVSYWQDMSGSNASASQTDPSLQPVFLPSALPGGLPAVRFNGNGSFLEGVLSKNYSTQTIVAVFRDRGSATLCCSGVYFSKPGFTGISTHSGHPPPVDNDDDSAVPDPAPVTLSLDYPGSQSSGHYDIRNKTVVVVLVYNTTGSYMWVDGCPDDIQPPVVQHSETYMVGTRNNELGRFFYGDLGELLVYPTSLSILDQATVTNYLRAKWKLKPLKCKSSLSDDGFRVSQQYATTRYVQAIQSRNTMWPIKFNGMLFGGNLMPYADYRDWGASNWWQNTRLPYGAMLACGDFDSYEVILRYYEQMLPFAQGRTISYFGHTGIYFTETKTIFGAYSPQDYGCNRDPKYPFWLEDNDYIHLDYGGDGGTPEVALAALDLYLYTGNKTLLTRYLPIATLAMDFFRQHYHNRTSDGKYIIWPTQALETWWCAGWNTTENRPPDNCCVDDMPTLSGIQSILMKLLALPADTTTAEQRGTWTTFLSELPDLPMSDSGSTLLAARVVSSGKHNSETPELYAVHPYRVFTVGRNITAKVDLLPAINSFYADPLAYASNSGWNQGIMNAALLGLSDIAGTMVVSRATTGSAAGYRFPGFAPHEQDYEPSADHFANMMSAINWMLLQPGDDHDMQVGTMVLFPAWPCSWDVQTKLWGPLNTTVEIDYAGYALRSLVVTPASRRSAVVWANCVHA